MTHEIVLELPEEEAMEISPEEEVESEVEVVHQPAIVIDDIPGAPRGTADLVLEVESPDRDDLEVSDSETKQPEPKSPWDWKATFPMGFIDWIKERYSSMPKHTGYDLGGLERAVSYLQRLDDEISKAIRGDIDGHLDAREVDEIRNEVEKGCALIEKRVENVKAAKKRNKTASAEELEVIVADIEQGLVKEAQQSPGIKAGIQITVSLFISTLARMCINGTVSGGHDIEDLFDKTCKKFKLDEREKYELRQLIHDMNFPIRFDRLSFVGEEVDESSEDNGDWAANYGGRNQ